MRWCKKHEYDYHRMLAKISHTPSLRHIGDDYPSIIADMAIAYTADNWIARRDAMRRAWDDCHNPEVVTSWADRAALKMGLWGKRP